MTMSSVTPTKSTGDFMARRISAFLKECGHEFTDVVLKSDQEPAIMAVMDEEAKLRGSLHNMKKVRE